MKMIFSPKHEAAAWEGVIEALESPLAKNTSVTTKEAFDLSVAKIKTYFSPEEDSEEEGEDTEEFPSLELCREEAKDIVMEFIQRRKPREEAAKILGVSLDAVEAALPSHDALCGVYGVSILEGTGPQIAKRISYLVNEAIPHGKSPEALKREKYLAKKRKQVADFQAELRKKG